MRRPRSGCREASYSSRVPTPSMIKLPRLLRIYRELLRDRKNPAKRLEAFQKLGQILVPGYRFSWPYPAWWSAPDFNGYLDRFAEADGFNTQRRWMLAQLLRLTAGVTGDTAECGVYRGAGSYTILQANAARPPIRHHHLFDSFAGISPPSERDGSYWQAGDLASGEAELAERLKEFPDKTLYPGWIPERFAEVTDRRFSFVHVDVDLYQPTFDSLAFFYPRLNAGAIFVCDDYGMQFCPGATAACDEGLAGKPEKMISLPDGGGFFIKGIETAAELYPPSPDRTEASR